MSHTISSSDVKRQFGAWLDWIGRTGEELVIETYGRPVAVLLAYEDYADFVAYRQRLAAEASDRETARRAALTPLPRGQTLRAAGHALGAPAARR
jgi:antitoxin (DNA-binding transcriptional repressor) of toxin-antitoxin stability system